MSSEALQLKIAYEELGMSPEEIAEDRGLELASVKAALMQSSSVYRRACGQEDSEEAKLNFSDADLDQVNAVIRNIALYAEDPNLQFKAATYIRDDKKGRKDVVKQMGGSQFNILMFNEQMQKIRGVADAAKRVLIGDSKDPINV
jgi:hypothetical protein